ncbi:MAG: hypothetical protein ACLFVR_09230 [Thiohalospira sp.]
MKRYQLVILQNETSMRIEFTHTSMIIMDVCRRGFVGGLSGRHRQQKRLL